MPRLSELEARIASLGELNNVVRALRSVSAARIQQAHGVLESVRQYTAMLHDSLYDAMRRLAIPVESAELAIDHRIVIAFGSEHGFVGAFNERVLTRAEQLVGDDGHLFVIGARAELTAAERGRQSNWTTAMATQVMAVDRVALQIAEELGHQSGALAVDLVYTRATGRVAAELVAERMMPFDLKSVSAMPSRRPTPLSTLPPIPLVSAIIDELLFAQLAHATTESLASENAARLAAMEAASDHISDKLEELCRAERELRQEEITTELLDVIAGTTVAR